MGIHVGIDVGIKNLAICIIDSTLWKKFEKGESGNPGILLWDNINIIGEPETCQVMLTTGKNKGSVCGKKATWYGKDDQDNKQLYYFCGKHHDNDCNVYIQPQMKNTNMSKLKLQAFKILDKLDIFKNVNYIVIENQPRINQKMKMFAASLEAYFIIRYQLDKNGILKTIKPSSAKNKLKLYNGPKIDTSHIIGTSKAKDYDRRKYLAQKHTEYFLNSAPDVLEKHYNGSKKKDDLADAFLHCLWSINQHVF